MAILGDTAIQLTSSTTFGVSGDFDGGTVEIHGAKTNDADKFACLAREARFRGPGFVNVQVETPLWVKRVVKNAGENQTILVEY